MFNFSPRRSTVVVNLMIAIVITLIVNFSYLIAMMVDERNNKEQQQREQITYRQPVGGKEQGGQPMRFTSDGKNIEPQMREQTMRHKPECSGVLYLSRDGYGYLISETNFSPEYPDSVSTDSIYVRSQTIRFYNLQDRDTLLCTLNPPMRGSHPSVDRVLKQNGNEVAGPVIYDRPKRNTEFVIQLAFYLTLSFLLLTIMTIKFDVHNFTYRRYLLRCTAVVVVTLILYFLAPFIDWRTGKMMLMIQHPPRAMLEWMVVLKCTIVLVVAILYGRIYGMLFEQQKILLENEHLRNENLQTRYNMLLGQISPHFFFNSLNSLSMLVREKNEEKALAYIDQLSYTFRYIIQNGQNTTTTLSEEMEFARAYGELFKVRYADKLFFDIEIEPTYNGWTLPALSLQPLIGNAVKHNTITRKQPLHISIRTEGSTLVVSNRKAPKLEPEPSTGIGLKNLRSRWQLITGSDIEIIDTEVEFTVRLPLQRPTA